MADVKIVTDSAENKNESEMKVIVKIRGNSSGIKSKKNVFET
jgi:hypothetical protein